MSDLFAIIGLGNPGKDYALTRHNVGFMAIDHLVDTLGVAALKQECSLVQHGRCDIEGQAVVFAKPLTFMNLSGRAIAWVAQFYKIPPEKILVIYDDVARPFGSLRLRKKGSSGGHNGMKSIIEVLGTQFPRLRVGIAPDHPISDLSSYVLGRFTLAEQHALKDVLAEIPNVLSTLLVQGIDRAMTQIN